MILRFLIVAFVVPLLSGEIIDRIAVTINRQVITELQVDEELRVTALLNHQLIVRDVEARRTAAHRLIEQLFVKHEMELSHYPLPEAEEIDGYLQQVRTDFGTDSGLDQALTAYHVSEQTLRDHLSLQLTTLRFIDVRFRPKDDISEADVQNYYRREIAAWKANRSAGASAVPPPSIESIRRALIDARTDEILNTWLEESRRQASIVYLDKSLQ